ncbi:MAG: hypothetical protein GX100_11400 [candidate division WS1 bacterium]|nr:hypothetical protein [candidate division WS1 bacterium]
MYLFPEVRVYRFPLEPTLEVTGGPNAGYQKQSAMVKPPVTLPGTRYLLLGDDHMVGYLPPGTRVQQVVDTEHTVVYVAELDPGVPLVLGAEGTVQLRQK